MAAETAETTTTREAERTLRVRDLMAPVVFTLREQDSLLQARAWFDASGVRHAPVVDGNRRLIGLAMQSDLLRRVCAIEAERPLGPREALLRMARVGEIMTTEVRTVGSELEIGSAARILFEGKLGCLPVVEHDELVGILSEAEFVRYFIGARER